MKLIVGLGNPGEEYCKNRHNIGFMILNNFAMKRKISFKKEGNTLVARRNMYQLVKPQTYMNLSGKAVKSYIEDIDDLLVISDDIYLPLGEIRIRQTSGDGGHKGLLSIIEELETINFSRIRIGVGQPEHNGQLKEYVLENFSEEELSTLEITTDFAIKLIDCFIVKGFQSMLNYYSKNKKSYSEKIFSESMTKGGK